MLTIVIYLQTSNQQNRSERINDGASTSTGQPGELSLHERCEVASYAHRVIHLLLSEDSSGADLRDMMQNRFDELTAYSDEIFSYLVMTRYGAQRITDLLRRQRRLRLFTYTVSLEIIKIVNEASSGHYRYNMVQNYDRQSNMIVVRENSSYSPNSCLCHNYRERSVLSTPFSLPRNFLNRMDIAYQLEVIQNEYHVTELFAYHIIPLPLISQFFDSWLSDQSTNIDNTNFNTCIRTLFGRLKRSMLKLVLASLGRAPTTENLMEIDGNFFSETLPRTHGMLSGNIFMGPARRGPFNPQFQRSGEDLLNTFEHDVEPIIGTRRYQQMLNIYNQMRHYIRIAPGTYPFLRLLNGLNIFLALHINLHDHEITPMNSQHWEEREPFDEELMNVRVGRLRRILRTQKYWAIKRTPRRSPRSIYREESNEVFEEQSCSVEEYSKLMWSEFVLDLLTISTEASSRDEEVSWSCNLTRLRNDYSFGTSDQTKGEYCVINFDEFLYSKISDFDEWRSCNSHLAQDQEKEWCLAWRRIMNNLDNEDSSFDPNLPKLLVHKFRSISYLRDVETMVRWLTTKIKEDAIEVKKNDVANFEYDPYHPKPRSNIIDEGLCFIYSISGLFLSLHECLNVFGAANNEIHLMSN